jgi:dipeptidyl aminopeptidase/acylaminoacyl peptidase
MLRVFRQVTARSARIATAFSLLVLAIAAAGAQTPRPLSHKDYDSWRIVTGQALSRDGKWAAYAYMSEDAEGDVIVRSLVKAIEYRIPAGNLPQPPVVPPAEVNPEAPPKPPSVKMRFSGDGQWLAFLAFPTKAEVEQARKDKKKPDQMPKKSLAIVNLATGLVERIANVKSFDLPEKGAAWLAYAAEAKPESRQEAKPEARPATDDDADQAEETTGNGAPKKEYGTELTLHHLGDAEPARVLADVLEFGVTRDAGVLWYTVSSRKEDDNGIYALAPGSKDAPTVLLKGKGKYTKVVWDRSQAWMAFFSNHDDAESKTPRYKVYLWDRRTAAATELVSSATPGFPQGMVVGEKGALAFSRDLPRLYVPYATPPKPPRDPKAEPAADDKVTMDLWRWNDDYVQPMQKIRARQELNLTYRASFDLAEKKLVPLAAPDLATVVVNDPGTAAIGLDDRPYRQRVDYDANYADLYLVDGTTGARKLALKEVRSGGRLDVHWSPSGRFAAVYWQKQWYAIDANDGSVRNLTEKLPVAFCDEQNDVPEMPPAYGLGGWTMDGAALLYDRYDVWRVPGDGSAAVNLTAGVGRAQKIQFRVVRTDLTGDEDERDLGLDPGKPLTLRGESEETRATGFFHAPAFFNGAAPQKLLWSDEAWRYVARAKDAEVFLVTASRFDEYPDLQATGPDFHAPKKISSGAEQMKPFTWGSAELIRFENADGVPLQATLFKPAGFDPKKKYPLMVYIYERLTQNVHSFVNPAPGHNVNTSYYVSNGYLVLQPDIVYTVGQPGQSALKCVLPAVQAVVDQGFVDEKAIGIQGHSWGGYQIAYMVGQTTRFRAAEAGAPVGNMTSAYSGIRWGSGLPRQFQYEHSQSRIGKTIFDDPSKFVENSPVFHARRVTTPMLILHNDNDDAVPWYQGIEFFLALRRNGKEAYLLDYNGEYHGLRRRADQKDYAIRMQQFFDHFLKGAPAPEWMDKGVPYVDREDEKLKFQSGTEHNLETEPRP